MADPLASVERIVKVALMIKEAVDKARKNKEECCEIRKRVVRVSALLTRLQETEMMEHPTTACTLEALEETLTRAHELVTACQRKNIMCLLCTAGSLSKQLREVKQDISDQMVDGIFAANVNATIILTSIQFAAGAPPPKVARVVNSNNSHSTDSDRYEVMNCEKNKVPAGSEPSSTPFPCITKFILPELEVATHHFSKKNIIGEGASAVVYKGVLRDGLVVAIKKFRNTLGFSEAHFYDEFNLVPKLQHKSVVKLVGYCHEVTVNLEWSEGKYFGVQKRHCLFVEEYMTNGSLETIMKGLQLQWSSRFQIIQGIAHGLRYLHEQRVVHSDLKPSNILLDSDMNPKISDFVIARMLNQGDDMTTRDVNYFAGTTGYMPPEYIVEGILSMKYDVYSFGVILLETISSMCISKPAGRQASVEWAWEMQLSGRMTGLFHSTLCDESPSQLNEMRRCIHIGLLCTQFNPADRPTMVDVLEMLNGKREFLPTPKKIRYTKRRALATRYAERRAHPTMGFVHVGPPTIKAQEDNLYTQSCEARYVSCTATKS